MVGRDPTHCKLALHADVQSPIELHRLYHQSGVYHQSYGTGGHGQSPHHIVLEEIRLCKRIHLFCRICNKIPDWGCTGHAKFHY